MGARVKLIFPFCQKNSSCSFLCNFDLLVIGIIINNNEFACTFVCNQINNYLSYPCVICSSSLLNLGKLFIQALCFYLLPNFL